MRVAHPLHFGSFAHHPTGQREPTMKTTKTSAPIATVTTIALERVAGGHHHHHGYAFSYSYAATGYAPAPVAYAPVAYAPAPAYYAPSVSLRVRYR